MPSQPERIPGERNPRLETHDMDQLTNTALSLSLIHI